MGILEIHFHDSEFSVGGGRGDSALGDAIESATDDGDGWTDESDDAPKTADKLGAVVALLVVVGIAVVARRALRGESSAIEA